MMWSILESKKSCPICQEWYSKKTTFHEMRLDTSEGMHTIDICEKCADFFDKSAEVMMKGRNDESIRLRELDNSEQEEFDEGDCE